MSKFKIQFLIIAIFVVLGACKELTNEEKITGNWSVNDYSSTAIYDAGELEAAKEQVVNKEFYNFSKGQVVIINGEDSIKGTWTIDENAKSLKLNYGEMGEENITLKEFSEEKMIWIREYTGDTLTYTLSKKK